MNTELENTHASYAFVQSVVTAQGIKAFLPEHISPDNFMRTAATAVIENPNLKRADKPSLLLALTRCAKDGLMPDGREAALIVRKQKVVYMPMVDGVIKCARQSGQVANIIEKVVYAQDEFEYVIDENGEHLTHRPAFVDGDEIVKVYAFAKLNSGELVVEVMSRADVEKIRDNVKSAKDQTSRWVKCSIKWHSKQSFIASLDAFLAPLSCFRCLRYTKMQIQRKNPSKLP